MANKGIAPPDMTSDIGKFRALYGDLNYVPLVPNEPGFGNYDDLSDDEIQAFIDQAAGSIAGGIGWLYLALAGQAALSAKSVKDADLAIDTTKRASELRALAQFWFERADIEQSDFFDVVPMGKQDEFIPEGSPAMYGRRYVLGRWS